MEKRPFSELGLSPEILKAVDKMGFEEASPIQTAVIPFGTPTEPINITLYVDELVVDHAHEAYSAYDAAAEEILRRQYVASVADELPAIIGDAKATLALLRSEDGTVGAMLADRDAAPVGELGREAVCRRGHAAGDRLADRDDVGLQAEVLAGEEPPRAPHPALHLVRDEEDVVLLLDALYGEGDTVAAGVAVRELLRMTGPSPSAAL